MDVSQKKLPIAMGWADLVNLHLSYTDMVRIWDSTNAGIQKHKKRIAIDYIIRWSTQFFSLKGGRYKEVEAQWFSLMGGKEAPCIYSLEGLKQVGGNKIRRLYVICTYCADLHVFDEKQVIGYRTTDPLVFDLPCKKEWIHPDLREDLDWNPKLYVRDRTCVDKWEHITVKEHTSRIKNKGDVKDFWGNRSVDEKKKIKQWAIKTGNLHTQRVSVNTIQLWIAAHEKMKLGADGRDVSDLCIYCGRIHLVGYEEEILTEELKKKIVLT